MVEVAISERASVTAMRISTEVASVRMSDAGLDFFDVRPLSGKSHALKAEISAFSSSLAPSASIFLGEGQSRQLVRSFFTLVVTFEIGVGGHRDNKDRPPMLLNVWGLTHCPWIILVSPPTP